MTKQELIYNALMPFLKKEIPFGYEKGQGCVYYYPCDEGEPLRCAVGRYMEFPEKYITSSENIIRIGLECLKPEVRDILNGEEWLNIQRIHDNIAQIIDEYVDLRHILNPFRVLQELTGLDLIELEIAIEKYVNDTKNIIKND